MIVNAELIMKCLWNMICSLQEAFPAVLKESSRRAALWEALAC